MTQDRKEQPIDTTPTDAYPMGHRVKIDKPYTPAHATDIRATFERARRQIEDEKEPA